MIRGPNIRVHSAVCTGIAPTGQPTAAPSQAVSFVSNSYFSFPYAPTSFDNRGECNAAKATCSRNYGICVSDLQTNNGLAVTINVPGGGGTTVAGALSALAPATATSVCASLSSKACSKLEATSCDAFKDSAATRQERYPHVVLGICLLSAVLFYT